MACCNTCAELRSDGDALERRRWGSSDDKARLCATMIAGPICSFSSHPPDTIKTCMQGDVGAVTYRGYAQTTRKLLAERLAAALAGKAFLKLRVEVSDGRLVAAEVRAEALAPLGLKGLVGGQVALEDLDLPP